MYKPVSQRKKISYTPVEKRIKKPFAATTTGIATNTILGIPKAALQVGKDILQGITRSVAGVGITAGNLPSKIASKITGKNIPAPFEEEIQTQDTKVGKFIFGEKPVRTVQKMTEVTKKAIEPYIGEKGAQFTALPLVGLGIAMDLSGWKGPKSVKTLGEIPESFLKKLARETDAVKIENTLKKVGLDDINSKALSQQFAPTKTVDEVKDVLFNYKPGTTKQPLKEIDIKVTTSSGATLLLEIPTEGLYYSEQPLMGFNNMYTTHIAQHITVFSDTKGSKKQSVQTRYIFPKMIKDIWSVSTDKDAIRVTLLKKL